MSLQASHLLNLSPKFFCADIKKFFLCPLREFLGWACVCAPSPDLPPPWKRQGDPLELVALQTDLKSIDILAD